MPVWEKSSPAGVKDSGAGGRGRAGGGGGVRAGGRGRQGEAVTASRRWEGAATLKSREGPADTFYCQSHCFFAPVKIFEQVDFRAVCTEMDVLKGPIFKKKNKTFSYLLLNKLLNIRLKTM